MFGSMKQITTTPKSPRLVWIYAGTLAEKLDAATWLDTTRELRRLGWHVTLINVEARGPKLIRDIETYGMPMPNIYLVRQLIFHGQALLFILRRWRAIDVVLFHPISAPWILPLRLFRMLTGKRMPRFVIDIRTVHMEPREQESRKARLRRGFYYLMNKWSKHAADGQTAITSHMAKVLHIPPPQLWGVWPSGVNVEKFSPAGSERRWPTNRTPIQLIYIGSLHYERNLMALCRAIERANRQGMMFHLLVVGEGTERAALESFAKTTSARIRVMPPIPHEKIPALLAQAHVGVLPFPDEEKFRVSSPIKLFEYMASGLAILASRITCHTDVIDSDECVFWAEQTHEQGLFDALGQIWRAQKELPNMGKHAAKAVEAWSWAEAAKKLGSALQQGLERPAHLNHKSLKLIEGAL
jgi:glycosyltransferase involved in cell wall biosynthesis